MNHLHMIGLLCGVLLWMPVDHLRSQTSSPNDTGSSLLTNKPAAGRTNRDHPWWVNLGAGPALAGNTFAMNAGMVYCYQLERSMISARILGVTNNNPTVQEVEQSKTIYNMADYGILYGPIWQTYYGYASIAAGIGLVRAGYETSNERSTNTSISIPIEAQWFCRFTSYAGIGVYTYATLNFEKPLYGVMVCAQLGAWETGTTGMHLR